MGEEAEALAVAVGADADVLTAVELASEGAGAAMLEAVLEDEPEPELVFTPVELLPDVEAEVSSAPSSQSSPSSPWLSVGDDVEDEEVEPESVGVEVPVEACVEPLLVDPLLTPEPDDEDDEESTPSSWQSSPSSSLLVDAEPEVLLDPEPELVDADDAFELFTSELEPDVVGTLSAASSSSSQSSSSSGLDSAVDVVTGAGAEVDKAMTLEAVSVTAVEVAGPTGFEAATAELEATPGADEAGVAVSVPSLIALFCAAKVVETMGHPTPGPSKFCNVTAAALSLANLESLESSVGKASLTVGLVNTWPAATLADNLAMKVSRSGGHWQGILIGLPSAPGIPSQSPEPVGFKPAS